jgi:mannosyltransferase OCH1-like enzyme
MNKDNIPFEKIIHQIWIGPLKRPVELMDSWKTMNPDCKYMLWNEDEIKKHFPNGLFNQKLYDSDIPYCGKADILRYEILYKFGGFYADADSKALRPLDSELFNHDLFTCYTADPEIKKGAYYGNCFCGAKKGSRIMKELIKHISKLPNNTKVTTGNCYIILGPALFTNVINKWIETKLFDIVIFPHYYFIPVHYNPNITKQYKFDKRIPYSTHLWGTTHGTPFNYKK